MNIVCYLFRFCLYLKSHFCYNSLHHLVLDARCIGLVVDIDECYDCFLARNDNIERDDSCTACLAASFALDAHSDFPQVSAEVDAL